MAERKLTLIIAGGTSLGAYEAGVLEEILYALKGVNEDTNQDDIKLDVMTGGSAGSITAALVARALLHDHVGMKRILHQSWVMEADIELMLEGESRGSLLSNKLQTQLAELFLLGSEKYPLKVVNRSPAAPVRLVLGFTLSNVVGMDYGIPYHQGPGMDSAAADFTTTLFSDFADFTLDASNNTNRDLWKNISTAAIASGSFPIAFPPKMFHRDKTDYPGTEDRFKDFLPGEVPFYDGGIFNNEPLRQAIDLSSEQDGGMISDDRLFLLIDPNLNTTKQDKDFLIPQSLNKNVFRLMQMALGEIEARDWMRVGRINTQLEWRDNLVNGLVPVFGGLAEADLDQRLADIKGQIQSILAHKSKVKGTTLGEDYLDERLNRIAEHHADALAELGSGDSADTRMKRLDLLKRTIFVINNASGLNRKSPMVLNFIGSDRKETAGDPMFAFAGFFDQDWREHDYRIGRAKAHRLLPKLLSIDIYPQETPDNGATDHNPLYELDPKWPDLTNVSIANASREKREKVLETVLDKISLILKQEPFDLSNLKVWFIKTFLIKRKLKKLLGLKGEPPEETPLDIA